MALTKISRSLLDTGISDSSDATAITIDSSENVLVGSGTSNGISGGTAGLQVSGTGFKGTISASRHDNNAYGSSLMLGKSRNTSVGSNTIVQDDDVIGAVTFFADDGTNLDSRVAEIVANVDGTPGENDTPGRLTFNTTSDGSAAPTERMRITSAGNVGIGTTSPSALLQVNTDASGNHDAIIISRTTHGTVGTLQNSGGNLIVTSNKALTLGSDPTSFFTATSSLIKFEVDGSEKMRITSAGEVLVGGTSNDVSTLDGIMLREAGNRGQIFCSGDAASNAETYYVYDNTNSEYEFYVSYAGVVSRRSESTLSDERKKQNITNITFGLDAVKELRPVSFDWKNNKGDNQLGFIAQDVESTSLSQLVGTYKDDNLSDAKSLNVTGLIPVLTKAIQEQQEQIEALQSEINLLKGE